MLSCPHAVSTQLHHPFTRFRCSLRSHIHSNLSNSRQLPLWCNSTLTTQFPLFQGGSWVLQNTRLRFPAPEHYTCVCGCTTGARCATVFQPPGHQPALTQQHCRIKEGGLHTPGSNTGIHSPGKNSVLRPQQNQHLLI